ncbi:MAG: hypothetical protein BMS9Abin08_1476 [Gammaproteobacteria bacterium]|nr:MAG: hypothetical protein BMS9Abin08_1476 [Gammaproteobacteria bacterium]
MKKSDAVAAVVLGLVIVLAVKYFQPQEAEQQELDLPPGTDEQQAVVEAPEPAIRYPIPEHPPQIEPPTAEPETTQFAIIGPEPQQQEPAEEAAETTPEIPLPTLDDSDDTVRQDLYTLAARQVLDALLNLNRIIRRFVVTVDNLPRKHLSNSKHRSYQAIHGQPRVEKDSSGLSLSEQNFARYDPFVDLLENMNSDQMITFYLHYYPLIQAAYEDLGYPSAYFNDRLIDVIDHLLEAPDIGGRISLVRPRVLYKYVDPELEALSAGQKVLIRIGPRNAARVKSKLRELRQALVGK